MLLVLRQCTKIQATIAAEKHVPYNIYILQINILKLPAPLCGFFASRLLRAIIILMVIKLKGFENVSFVGKAYIDLFFFCVFKMSVPM